MRENIRTMVKKITYKLLLNYFTNLFHMYTPENLRKMGRRRGCPEDFPICWRIPKKNWGKINKEVNENNLRQLAFDFAPLIACLR